MMKEKPQIKQILLHLAEEDIPPDHDPWEAVQRRLVREYPDQKTRRSLPGRQKILSTRRLQLAGLAAGLLIILAGAFYLSTPQGQVTAEALLRLFTNTDTNTIPLPPGVPTEGIRPTLTPGGPPRTFGPPTPWPSQEAGGVVYGLTLADAEKLAQYRIRVPGSIPDGFRLDDISYDRQSHAVEQLYDLIARNGPSFLLEQSPTPASQPIGPDATINQYRVGDTVVDWVDGGWIVYAGSDHQQWEPGLPTRTFRWMQDGYYFTIWFMGMTSNNNPLTMADMQALLEDLIGASAAFPISPENPVFHALPEVTQAEQAEGVHFLGPTSLPVGSVFEQAVYDRSLHTLKLTYQPQKGSSSLANVHLTILEIPVAYYQYQLWDGYPPGAIEQVSVDQGSAVGETTGYLITGSVIDGQYQPNHSLSLIWVTQGLVISIQVTNAVDQAMPIDQAEILAIAIAMN